MTSWNIPKIKEYDKDHKAYYFDGEKYSRVTRTLSVIGKPGLLTWYANVGRKKADEIIETRQNLGTKCHKLFELELKGKNPNVSLYEEEIQENMNNFKVFVEHARLRMEACEQAIYSKKFKYAGTADYIGKYTTPSRFLVRGHKPKFPTASNVIGDWKTSRSLYPEYWLQMSAYVNAFYELTGLKYGAFLVQFRNNKIKIKEMTWDELEDLFEVYKAVLKLYKWKYKNG